MTHEYNFLLPASKGVQGGRDQYLITAPMTILRRLLALDIAGDVMQRSQRELNRTRARKISRYIADSIDTKRPYFLPALCGNINGDVKFIPSSENPKIGILQIPMDSDVRLFDGQTRSYGIMELLNERSLDTDETVSLVLTVNLDLITRQQFFSDVNDNATKPPAAISMAYNGTNAVNQLAMHISRCITGLGPFVDYEHNVVPATSTLLISFKALTDATRKMLGLRMNDNVTDQQKENAVLLWNAWGKRLEWATMLQDSAIVEYRKSNIALHGVMINAIGIATGQLLESASAERVAAIITNASLNLLSDFSHSQWQGICVDTNSGSVQSNNRAQLAAAARLLDLIQQVPQDNSAPDGQDSSPWFAPLIPAIIEPERYAKLAGDLDTVMEELSIDEGTMAAAIVALTEENADSPDNILKTLTNIRFMRQWAKSLV